MHINRIQTTHLSNVAYWGIAQENTIKIKEIINISFLSNINVMLHRGRRASVQNAFLWRGGHSRKWKLLAREVILVYTHVDVYSCVYVLIECEASGDQFGLGENPDGESDSYEYELMGVTVHTGTAEGGHYYSFIRENMEPADNDKNSSESWYYYYIYCHYHIEHV